jgi:hypothetical protein
MKSFLVLLFITSFPFSGFAGNEDAITDLRQASGLEFKGSDYYVQQIGEAMISKLRQKVLQISQTYTHQGNQNFLEFTTIDGTGCSALQNKKEEVVAKIQYTRELPSPTKHIMYQTERISYYGCQNKLLFSEVIQCTGGTTPLLSTENVINVMRKFPLQNSETRRLYRVLDRDDQAVITIDTTKDQTKGWKHTTFKISDVEILDVANLKTERFEKLSIIKRAYSYFITIDKSQISAQSTSEVPIKAIVAANGTRYFYNDELISQATFDTNINEVLFRVMGGIRLGGVVDMLMNGFPESQAAPKLNRLLDQLNEAIILNQSGQSKDRINELLLDIQAGANHGTIIDNRN